MSTIRQIMTMSQVEHTPIFNSQNIKKLYVQQLYLQLHEQKQILIEDGIKDSNLK